MFLYILNIKLSSKQINQLKQFLLILKLYKIKLRLNLKLSIFSNVLLKNKKISVLKSPHVHKKAQEHFSLKSYTFFFKVSSNLFLEKFLLFLNSFNNFFVDIIFKLHFKFFFKKLETKNQNQLSKFFPDNYFNPNQFLILNFESVSHYVRLMENFGEFKLFKYIT